MTVMRELGAEAEQALDQVLGYLNFSSGAADPLMLANLNRLYQLAEGRATDTPTWRIVTQWLQDRLKSLRQESPAFQDSAQAQAALDLLARHVLPGYLHWHRDLLFHQGEETLFGPFFLGRTCEAVLQQGPPWNEEGRVTTAAIGQLNDYLGHRPLAVLETQKTEPYAHERVRPVPLYVRGAGVGSGRYSETIETALSLLEQTDEDLLRNAHFDPDLLMELALDPRAYDFDHPVNKRPNYHFGQWDPHHIDGQGRYRRFVVQQVTLDALVQRCELTRGIPRDELMYEAAAVLVGTMLMASGVSGAGPDTHDSSVSLATLLPHIARYRDAYYERLLHRVGGKHGERLRKEARLRKQPFGGARQHLNAELARLRASQLEHVHLARIFARMGYPQAAAAQAAAVPVASARMLCQIDCLLTAGRQAIEAADLCRAASLSEEMIELLKRAIECGAMVDPWNMLGFDGQFSLFPALENSVRDHRVDELVQLMDQVFAYDSRVWSEAAARDEQAICQQIGRQFEEQAIWWRQFAAHEAASIRCADALDVYHSSRRAAETLNLWHKGGAETGDVRFWARHAEMFDTPKAYALVVGSLLDQHDFVSSMALLSRWLGQAEQIGLEQGESSFSRLAERWLLELRRTSRDGDGENKGTRPVSGPTWLLVEKFFDYLEANAEQYWQAPRLRLGGGSRSGAAGDLLEADEDPGVEEQDLFSAAYEGVVYRDSADDGVDGEIFGVDLNTHDELARESNRIAERLAFLSCLAGLWKIAATSSEFSDRGRCDEGNQRCRGNRVAAMRRWIGQAAANRRRLTALLTAVRDYRIPNPAGDHDSMVEYDRKRLTKESLLERIIAASVDTANASRLLMAALISTGDSVDDATGARFQDAELAGDQETALAVLAALLRDDRREVRRLWRGLIDQLAEQPLLYVPISKGGDPRGVVAARIRQRSIQDLMIWLPRLGLLVESCELIDTARKMERDHPVGPGAVTEFDELFKVGYKAIIETLVDFAQFWNPAAAESARYGDARQAALVACLERLTESLLVSWLAHSRTLRLSVLEKVNHANRWSKLVAFIKKYGQDLFTQPFLNLGNLRAILYQGPDSWLKRMQEDDCCGVELRLVSDLDVEIPRQEAAEQLGLVLEAVVENYGEYRDYNSTTTQSDRGELLYMLLDFLRLRTQYDRVCWNLKPIVLAHETLVRRGQQDAARSWRRALSERIGEEAEHYLQRLAKLQKKYAMRMPTVADRLGECFLRPMEVDRMCALIEPAVKGAGDPEASAAFELLEHETEALTRQPTGVGLDTPAWLAALEEEVERVRRPAHESISEREFRELTPLSPLPLEEVQRQIEEWASRS